MVVRRRVSPSKGTSAPKKRVAATVPAVPTSTIDRAMRGKYVGRRPTDYHKQFARWLVSVVGVKPSECENLNQAFLLGLQMGIVARPDFMTSDFLKDWRESNGMTKPGRLPGKTEAVQDEDEVDEPDEFDDDEFEEDEEDEEDDEEDDDEEEDEEDEEDEEEEIEPEPEPVKPTKRPKRAAKAVTPRSAAKKAPTTSAAQGAKAKARLKAVAAQAVADDDFF